MLPRFHQRVKSTIDIVQLIKDSERNDDGDLSIHEIRKILLVTKPFLSTVLVTCSHARQRGAGRDASEQDARFVLGRIVEIANASAHGGFRRGMTADPDFVSRAIFEWWWQERVRQGPIPAPDPRDDTRPSPELTQNPSPPTASPLGGSKLCPPSARVIQRSRLSILSMK